MCVRHSTFRFPIFLFKSSHYNLKFCAQFVYNRLCTNCLLVYRISERVLSVTERALIQQCDKNPDDFSRMLYKTEVIDLKSF